MALRGNIPLGPDKICIQMYHKKKTIVKSIQQHNFPFNL